MGVERRINSCSLLRALDRTCCSSATARLAAGEARDDDVEDGRDAVDDGHEHRGDAVDDSHEGGADCAEDAGDLDGMSETSGRVARVIVGLTQETTAPIFASFVVWLKCYVS